MNKERISNYNREYRLKNKKKIKKLQDDYYQEHRLERIKNARNWTLNNKEKALDTRRKYMKTLRGRLTSIKGSAGTRNIEYILTDKEAIKIMSNPCYYCGEKTFVGIDRIDSKVGYVKENCVACCSMCNYMKKDFTQEEFLNQCKLIASNHQ